MSDVTEGSSRRRMRSRAVRNATVLLLTIGLSAPCWGSGSFRPEIELAPILAQVPSVERYLATTLDLAEGGSADRIGTSVNPHLGGTRIGPYVIRAKPKGSAGGYIFELTVRTTVEFLDGAWKTSDLRSAEHVRERFESVELRAVRGVDFDQRN